MRVTTLQLQDAGLPGDLVTNDIVASGTLTSTSGSNTSDYGIRVKVIDKLTGEEVARQRVYTDDDGNWQLQLGGVNDGRYKIFARPLNDGETPDSTGIRRFDLDQTADERGRPGELLVDETRDGVIDPAESSAVAFKVKGLDADATGQVTFTDDTGGTITLAVGANGPFVIDLSSLDLGLVTSTLVITDSLGNTATVPGNDVVVCFFAGTRIATPLGDTPVEALHIGEPVVTADGSVQRVRWIGRQTVSTRFGDPRRLLPIRIRAGALAAELPRRDLLVSPDHALLLDGLLVHAAALVNGRTITRETEVPECFVWWHVELERHALLLAEGVAAESFLEAAVARGFDNAAERAPSSAPAPLPMPRVQAARQVPAALRRRLAERAAALEAVVAAAA